MHRRSEKTMVGLIIKVASEDKRIRAVSLGGSRIFSYIEKDKYQDYDIVYYVNNILPLLKTINSYHSSVSVRCFKYLPHSAAEVSYI